MTTAAGAHDQELVLFYAVSGFMSFLVGLMAMARFSRQEHQSKTLVMNLVGAAVVAFTLGSTSAADSQLRPSVRRSSSAYGLYRLWARAGKPRGIASVVTAAEHSD